MKSKLLLIGWCVLLTAGMASAQLADTILIKGTVRDSATNLPLNQSKIKVVFTFGVGSGTVVDSALTDANGTYVMTSVPIGKFGSTAVQASRPGYVTQSASVAGNPPDTLTRDFRLVSSGAADETTRVSGAITDSATGVGLAGAYVAVYTLSYGLGGLRIDTLGYTMSDQQGRYLVKMVTDMTSASVISYANGYYTRNIDGVGLQPATTLDLVLTQNLGVGKVLRGVVTDTSSAQPLANAIIFAYNTLSRFFLNDSTDALGRYAITGIPAGINNLTVEVVRAGYRAKTINSVSVGTDTTALNVQLHPTVIIETHPAGLTSGASGTTIKINPQPAVNALTFTGKAAGQVALTVLAIDGTPVFTGSQIARDGHFAFTWDVDSRLPAGTYVYRLTIGEVTETGALVLQK